MKLVVPPCLEPYRQTIEATAQAFVKIETDQRKTTWWESKSGGFPYLPKGFDHPKDAKGDYMPLLAQINFADMPTIDGYPSSGILQFYLSADDDVHGLDFDDGTNQENWRVVYHPSVHQNEDLLVTDFSYLPSLDDAYFPAAEEEAFSFSLETDYCGGSDFRFNDYVFSPNQPESSEEESDFDELHDAICDTFSNDGHKIGGYAAFTQHDPREDAYESHQMLLLQLDSNTSENMIWGDSGVANFFIRPDDLARCDFSKVLYNWDCC